MFNHKQSLHGIWKITDDIQIIEKYHSQEDGHALLSSYFFVTKKLNGSFEGYSSDGIFRIDLKNEILAKQINKTAHFYDIINLNNSNLQLHWQNSIQTKMCLMTIQKNNKFLISTVTLN